MFLGVGFYTIVVGSLTSYVTQKGSVNEDLNDKIKALDAFKQESGLDNELYILIKKFL